MDPFIFQSNLISFINISKFYEEIEGILYRRPRRPIAKKYSTTCDAWNDQMINKYQCKIK